MKHVGYLMESISEMANLELAYYKARRGKSDKPEVYRFGQQLYANLKKLQTQLLTGDIETGHYHLFTIYDPKKRVICAAPFAQRVMHHALMNVCHPFFDRVQISDSYASRTDKGTYAALEKAKTWTRQYAWYMKLDVRKYFDSIDHRILKQQLRRLFKDGQLLLLFDQIIDSYAVSTEKGLPIGNLTSQYFANHYLAGADHYLKETLGIRACMRYMDDVVLWQDNKQSLMAAGTRYRQYVCDLLALELKPECLNHSKLGLPFLGYRVFPSKIRLSPASKRRFLEKYRGYIQKLESGIWNQAQFQRHVSPLIAFTMHAHALSFRQHVIQKTGKRMGMHRGFEPRPSWRQLEQQCQELPFREPQQQQSVESQQQLWVSCCVHPPAQGRGPMAVHEQMHVQSIAKVMANSRNDGVA